MKRLTWIITVIITSLVLTAGEPEKTPLAGTVTTITGEKVKLESYKGKVVLVVNVASRCGLTRQYKQLQKVYATYKDKGLVILGFPCNQFGKQEPGTDAEIKTFCETKFSVTFPMFSKVDVNGKNALPLYAYLTSDKIPLKDKGRIKWNFEKFLFNRKGELVGRFRSRVKPDAPQLIKAIEAALGSGAAEKKSP